MHTTKSSWTRSATQLAVACVHAAGLANPGQAAGIASLGDSEAPLPAEASPSTRNTDSGLEGLKAGNFKKPPAVFASNLKRPNLSNGTWSRSR